MTALSIRGYPHRLRTTDTRVRIATARERPASDRQHHAVASGLPAAGADAKPGHRIPAANQFPLPQSATRSGPQTSSSTSQVRAGGVIAAA